MVIALLRALPRPLLSLASRVMNRVANRSSLRAALSSAYFIQMALAIGLSAGLARRAIDRTGLHLARQQQASIAAQVSDRVVDNVQRIQALERAARDALTLDLWSDVPGLERWLWQTARARGSEAIAVRNRQGLTVKVLRQSDGGFVSVARATPASLPVVHRLSDSGDRLEPIALSTVERFDAIDRVFDSDAATTSFVPPVIRFQIPTGTSGTVASVVEIVSADRLEHLLDRLYVGDRGLVAVVDRAGQPISSSAFDLEGEAALEPDSAEREARKLRQAIAALQTEGENTSATDTTLATIDTPRQGYMRLDGWRYQVALTPVELSERQKLWVVSALAERDFGRVGHRDVIGFVAIGLVATFVVGAIGLLKVRTTIRAIAKLEAAIDALGERRWSQVDLNTRPPEFRHVNASVARAARRLRDVYTKLYDRNAILEKNARFKTWLFDDSVQRLSSLQTRLDSQDADCGTVTKTTRQTLSLLENAAELNQLQLESPALPLQPVSLDRCIEAAIARHRDDLETHQIELVRQDVPMPVFVCAESRKLERVLDELLENAIQFSHDGSTIAISTALAVSAVRSSYHDLPEASVSIADNGTGIDPQEQHKLFQPFVRISHHDRDRCGYGLGLAIAERMMAAMGGRLEVYSEGRDRGTIARLTLPVASRNGTTPMGDWDALPRDPESSPTASDESTADPQTSDPQTSDRFQDPSTTS